MWQVTLQSPKQLLRCLSGRSVRTCQHPGLSFARQTSHCLIRSSPQAPCRRDYSSGKHRVNGIDRVLSAEQNGPFLDVSWKENGTSRYPFIYLRDNCPCSACRSHHGQRLFNFVASNVDVNIQPKSVKTAVGGTSVELTWPDGHQSSFDNLWLNDFQLRQGDDHLSGADFTLPKRQLWSSNDLHDALPQLSFSFNDVLNNFLTAYQWLCKMCTHGFTLLTDAGTDGQNVFQKIARRMGGIQRTHYGEIYMVEHKPDAETNSLAYDGLVNFPLHTDVPFYSDIPRIVTLHALTQAPEGGETLFCDGFLIAEKLRQHRPDMYKLLSQTEVLFSTQGKDPSSPARYSAVAGHRILQEDDSGEVKQVTFSTNGRSSRVTLQVEDVHDFYRAYRRFSELCRDSSHCFPYLIKPGDIAVFDVHRVIHGRFAMEKKSAIVRRLQGCYVSWDHALSYMRVLHRKLYAEEQNKFH